MKKVNAKRIVTFLLVVVLIIALSVPAFAANVSYAFSVKNTGQELTPYTGAANTKVYQDDPATIKLSYTDATVGDGFYMYLAYRTWFLGYDYHKSTTAYWYNNNNYLLHPAYIPGQAKVDTDYYILGRVDDTSPSDRTYTANGLFNADWTNP